MEHAEAIQILIRMLDKPALDEKEKAAITTAIGVLGWTSLARGRIRAIKAKREKNKGA